MTETRSPYLATIVGGLFVLSAVTAYLWPYGFSAFPPLAALLLLPLFRPRDPNPVFVALVTLAFLAMVSLAWSPVFANSPVIADYAEAEKQTWAKALFQLALYGTMVITVAMRLGSEPRRLRLMVVATAGVLATVLFLEALSGAAAYQAITTAAGETIRPDIARRNVAQGTYALALVLWPAWSILVDWDKRRLAIPMVAAAIAAPLLLNATAPVAAIALGGVVYALARGRAARAARIVGVAFALVILSAPWAVLAARPMFDLISGHIGASWAARLEIWVFFAEQATTRPLLGWGFDGSRAFQAFQLHPHSAPIQIWVELGAAGAALLALVWVTLTQRAGHLGAQALAAATVYFVIGGLSFGMWQEWWLGLGAVTCLWCLVAARSQEEDDWVIEA